MTNGLGYLALAILSLLFLAAFPWVLGFIGQYLHFVFCHFNPALDQC
jgi:hypothetical protein